MKTSSEEALRKEGVYVPGKPGAQKPRKTRDKSSGEKTSSDNPTLRGQKDTKMENTNAPVVTAPVVTGTPAPAAPVASAPVAPTEPLYTVRRAGGLAIDTFVVVATTSAILGAGFGVYKFATKAK